MLERLKEKLAKKETIFVTTLSYIGWSGLLRIYKGDPPDLLILDAEHGILGSESCENLLRTCNLLELPIIVRAADSEYHLMSRYVDMGADGILVPRVETPVQAANAVKYLRFPPKGKKGCGGYSLLRGENAFERFGGDKLIFLQIESPEGAGCLDEILAANGDECAGIIVGPGDLSIAMGNPFDYYCKPFVNQVEAIFATCKRHGKPCGIFCDDAPMINFWHERGADIIWSGTEVGLMSRGYRELCGTIKRLKA